MILSAGAFVLAMGAVSRERGKLNRKVLWEGKKIVWNLTEDVIKGALVHKFYALCVVILKINASCVISGCCGHVVAKLQIINYYFSY